MSVIPMPANQRIIPDFESIYEIACDAPTMVDPCGQYQLYGDYVAAVAMIDGGVKTNTVADIRSLAVISNLLGDAIKFAAENDKSAEETRFRVAQEAIDSRIHQAIAAIRTRSTNQPAL